MTITHFFLLRQALVLDHTVNDHYLELARIYLNQSEWPLLLSTLRVCDWTHELVASEQHLLTSIIFLFNFDLDHTF